jgi:hypothetical protein
VWTGPVPKTPILRARFPEHDWRTEGRVKNYWDMYTLNDGLAGTVADTLLTAAEVYRQPRYREALARLGDFLLLAQLPDPQPAWAQQYDYEMRPIWARRFEPPAVTGWESQDAVETLLKVHAATGDLKYLAPITRALAYLKQSRLPDGRLARYYELKTNRPLYMTRAGDRYSLTYEDTNLPDHYGWKVPSRVSELEGRYAAANGGQAGVVKRTPPGPAEIRGVIETLDADGRWISTYDGERLTGQPGFKPGFRYLGSDVFNRNVELLSRYLETAASGR